MGRLPQTLGLGTSHSYCIAMTATALLWAITTLGLVKILFSFASWMLALHDKVFRTHLDELWDNLHAMTLHESVALVLQAIGVRLRATLERENAQTSLFFAFLIFNYVACILSLVVLGTSHGYGIITSLKYINFGGYVGLLGLSITLSFIDILSMRVTAAFLVRVGSRNGRVHTIANFALSICVIAFAAMTAMLVFHFVTEPRYYYPLPLWPGGAVWSIISRAPSLLDALPQRPTWYFLLIGFFATAASLPTIIYIFSLGLLLTVRPDPIWRGVRRIIFLLTTEKRPILEQIGSLVGGAAAIATLIAKVL